MRIFVAMGLAVLMLGPRAEAKRARYELRVQTISVGAVYNLRLWDRVRQRVLWKRHVDYGFGVSWSKDRRALAVTAVARGTWRIWVWREGFRLRDFKSPGDSDYTMGVQWSSDNRRPLMLVGGSGSVDAGTGGLYCLKLERWPNYKYFSVGNEAVRKFAWKSRRLAVYQGVDDRDRLKKPQIWRAP